MNSHLTHLECTACGQTYPADQLVKTCPACGKVLYARYDLDGAAASMTKAALAGRPWNLWRYAEIMPVQDRANALTLGEGGTPLLPAPALGRQTFTYTEDSRNIPYCGQEVLPYVKLLR